MAVWRGGLGYGIVYEGEGGYMRKREGGGGWRSYLQPLLQLSFLPRSICGSVLGLGCTEEMIKEPHKQTS